MIHTLTSVAVSALFMHNGFSKGSFNNYMDTWQLAIRENIHNMSQGPPNPGFMQEKVQKRGFSKKALARIIVLGSYDSLEGLER